MLAKKPEVKDDCSAEREEIHHHSISVFFDLNKTRSTFQKDLVNVRYRLGMQKENNSNDWLRVMPTAQQANPCHQRKSVSAPCQVRMPTNS